MGRPPSSGGPAFRFNGAEVLEMETILQDYNNMMPAQEVLVAIADKFSNSQERQGKFVVQTKQIWNWFQNKRYAVRAKTSKTSTKLTVSSMQSMSTRAPLHSVPVLSTRPEVKATAAVPEASSASVISGEDILSSSRLPQSAADSPGMIPADNTPMEFEARSARDGAWYDVASFLSLRNFEAGCAEVLVRFAGFGPEEDEWINVTTHVRHRSLPCESSECVAVLPGDLILCFQEGKEQALYFDAHVLDAQRRRHDARGCRCRFLVRYDHDQSEEIVPLRKICRRPETDYRLQQLHAIDESSAELRKSASSTEHMKSVSAKEQHKIVSSVEQIKTNVDSPYSKAGISQSMKSPAPVLLVSPSSISEEQKGVTDCFTDKTTRDINAARSNSQQSHSHLEVINLDPETEVENDSHEVKNATNDMAVDEPLEKQTDIMPMCGINATSTPNMIEEVRIEASLAEHVPITEQIDPELMIVETNSTTDEGKTNMDNGKDDMTSSTDTYVTGEASLPAVAGVNDVEGGAPELTSSICNMTLGQLVPEMSWATDAGKADIDSGNVTLTSTIDNVDDSGPSNSSTSNANVDNCSEKDAPTEEGIK